MPAFLSTLIAHPHFFRIAFLCGGGLYFSLAFFNSLGTVLMPFLTGGVGAYLLNKPLCHLEKRGIPRSLGAGFLILGCVLTLIFLSSVALPYLQKELILLGQGLPQMAETIFDHIQPLFKENHGHFISLHSVQGQISSYIGDIIKWSIQFIINLLTNGILLANVLSLVILTPIIMFYLLRDWPRLINVMVSSLPESLAPRVISIFKRIDETLSAYLKGQLTVCCVLAILYCVSLWSIGLQKPFLLGIMTGILSFIPYLGMVIGLLASLSVAFTHFASWSQIVLLGVVFASIALIEGHILTPRFVGGRIGLHPVWILFALLAFGTWFGFVGILIAIPSAAIFGVCVREAVTS